MTELDLRDNPQLAELPMEIGHLQVLKKLDLNGNNLKSLPKEIGFLTDLQILDIRNNEITSEVHTMIPRFALHI